MGDSTLKNQCKCGLVFLGPEVMQTEYRDVVHGRAACSVVETPWPWRTYPSPISPEKTEGANAQQVGGTYYQKPIQPWDFITANGIGFLEGNAIKYISRHREKNGKEDLQKAIHYLQKAIEVYYP